MGFVHKLTPYPFTGQYSYVSDEATDLGDSGFGLMYYGARFYDPALGRFISADTIIPSTQGAQGWDRYAYVNNNPVRYTDPTGHICVNDDGDGDVAMAGNCGGGANVHYNGGLQGSPTGWTGNGGGTQDDDDDQGDAVGAEMPMCSLCDYPPSTPSHTGYSNPYLDELYFFWEHFVNPINDIIELDDIYRISSHGGWKAARYSLNLGVLEAIVQGGRQAYRDSWYQTLTPTQRIGRPILVGIETLITDVVANKIGKGFRNAGFVTGGPLGAAGAQIAAQTYTTKLIDQFWMEKVNPRLTPWTGVWP